DSATPDASALRKRLRPTRSAAGIAPTDLVKTLSTVVRSARVMLSGAFPASPLTYCARLYPSSLILCRAICAIGSQSRSHYRQERRGGQERLRVFGKTILGAVQGLRDQILQLRLNAKPPLARPGPAAVVRGLQRVRQIIRRSILARCGFAATYG